MKNVVIDFETYYDKEISVTTMGLRNYVAAADAYIVSVVSDDLEFCGPISDVMKLLGDSWLKDPEIQPWAFNAEFDRAWWKKYFPMPVNEWKCGLDLGAFHQMPRDLAGLCNASLKIKIDKTIRDEMKGVHFEELPEEKQQRVIEYCLNDSIRGKQIIDTLPPMTGVEDQLAAHTRLLNRRGVRVNLEKLKRDCEQLELLRYEAMRQIPWVESGGKPLSYPAFAEWCKMQDVLPPTSLDKRDAECTQWIADHPEQSFVLKHMRTFRGANTKREKLKLLIDSADENNIIPLNLLYCGARHTRRWSSPIINVQNLDAKRVFEEEMAELPFFKEHPEEKPGIFMREYLLPPPGMKFGIIDYSQIEPRCLNWIVRNDEMLDAIRAGYGIYEAHAKATMGWKGKPGTLKHENPDLYKFAKIRVLALGYGMGSSLFKETARLIGIHLTDGQAKTQVDDFRKTNPKIVRKWRELDQLIRRTALSRDDRTLMLQMPTGDWLTHFNVRSKIQGGYESFTIKSDFSQMSHQSRLWGGTLTENITQRMARDILGEALLRLEKAGIPVVFHAHDEAVIALNEATAQQEFEEAKRIMAVPPEWCADLPIEVDGGIFDHYTKLG